MGYKLDNNVKTSLCTKALKMAIKNRKYPDKKLIQYSDRNFQYCNPKYTAFAENGIAERINRTLKYEYGLRNCIKILPLLKKSPN